MRESTGKGFGLFAKIDIARGRRILSETPLISLPPGTGDSRDIWKQFKLMKDIQKAKFNKLSCAEDTVPLAVKPIVYTRLFFTSRDQDVDKAVEEELTMRAIFNTNCVAMGTKNQWGVGVFELYSRINHSCIPNVHNSYNASIQREVVHAVKPIAAGEEILTSYIPNVRTKAQRQAQLKQYGFRCECTACTGANASQHEKRRKRLFQLDQTFAAIGMADTPLGGLLQALMPSNNNHNLAMAKDNVLLLQAEGLTGMDLDMG